MKTWNIFQNDNGKIEVVPEGFNFWAFLFAGFWALAKNLRFIGVIGLALTVFANRLPAELDIIAIPVLLVIMLCFGFKGNSWVAASYEKNNYRLIKQVKAASRQGARSQIDLADLSN